MKGSILTHLLYNTSVTVYRSPGCTAQHSHCIFLAGESSVTANESLLECIAALLEPSIAKENLPSFLIVSPAVKDWDAAYSPWPASIGDRHFDGQASDYFYQLQTEVLPQLKKMYSLSDHCLLSFAGYSLAGLAALYAMLHTTTFRCCASISGSLWYPGWTEYLEQHIKNIGSQSLVYLSLGKAEVKTRSALMQSNKVRTEYTEFLLAEHLSGSAVFFEWNNGNHFYEIPQRITKALLWILNTKN